MKKRKIFKARYAPVRQFYRPAAAALAAAVITGALTACGASSTVSAKQSVMETAAAPADMEFCENADFGAGALDTAEKSMESPKVTHASLNSANPIQPTARQRKLIRNVNLNVETTEFDALISSISQSVTDLGGYLESSDISGASLSSSYEQKRYASLTARIPSDKLDGFISQVDTQGNITNKSESTQDVTLQYSDVESRKKSLTIEQERLWALLEKADSVDAVIALESRLSEIRYQLETLESQLRTYDNQVDYSTVYLSISEVKVFTPTSPDSVFTRMQKGFQKSADDVKNGLLNFSVWFVSSTPILIVLAVIIGALLLIVKVSFSLSAHSMQKKMKKRGSAETPITASSENQSEEPSKKHPKA